MGDLQFAKQFLTALDNKPNKYQADHVFDPKTFQMRLPYTLPKLSTPPHPPPPKSVPVTAAPPGSEPSTPTITLVLKSARNPNMTLVIPSVPPATVTIQVLKERIQATLGGPSVVPNLDKVKLLLNKKPIPPSKQTVAEALVGSGITSTTGSSEVEFGVMVMGGAPDPPQTHVTAPLDETTASEQASAAAAETGGAQTESKKTGAEGTPMEDVQTTATTSVLESKEFWDDLQRFLEQRIGSADDAGKARGIFERAWRSATEKP
ncbi:uncharacterized protein Z520_10225 [Fonsecaea multimorphosa CBS 102226]|uniref:Ubiquitin-like domain-containing protein n=1 Tax=Fonsecaea multimorphosa CBS 102226 TaxID=1442371 RepID=A0A0D2KBX0_9EURO|nr:uncharacterized protein Z520_10225 [Fonsecaea multimorphosa CBS 102226]KIX94198.1 hypothetical protein Z520_10225 [Fonsecaea multimorphosa CBS 102226]OAL19549.1 hypothetical protein AYO22_09711 [Fonsecaea multimorphosa]